MFLVFSLYNNQAIVSSKNGTFPLKFLRVGRARPRFSPILDDKYEPYLSKKCGLGLWFVKVWPQLAFK